MPMEKERPEILNDKSIKKEIRKLNKLFEGIEDEDKKTLVKSLIEEASFSPSISMTSGAISKPGSPAMKCFTLRWSI